MIVISKQMIPCTLHCQVSSIWRVCTFPLITAIIYLNAILIGGCVRNLFPICCTHPSVQLSFGRLKLSTCHCRYLMREDPAVYRREGGSTRKTFICCRKVYARMEYSTGHPNILINLCMPVTEITFQTVFVFFSSFSLLCHHMNATCIV